MGITDIVPSQLPTVGQVSPGEVPCLELGLFTRVEWNFPAGTSGKETIHVSYLLHWQRHKRHGFDPWVRKIPWRRAANHFSILAWRIPRTEEPGGLQSMGSQRVGHD